MNPSQDKQRDDRYFHFNKTHFLTIIGIIVLVIIALTGGAVKFAKDFGSNSATLQVITIREQYTVELDSVKRLKDFAEARYDTAGTVILQLSEVLKKAQPTLNEPLRSEVSSLFEPQDFIKSVGETGDGYILYEIKSDTKYSELFAVFWARGAVIARPNTVIKLDSPKGKFKIPDDAKAQPMQNWFNLTIKGENGRQRSALVTQESLKDKGNLLIIDDFGNEGKAFRW